jgi:cell division protein FtsL
MFLFIVLPGIYQHIPLTQNMLLGLMALVTTIFIGYLNYQHAQDRLFKDLFKEFNERYDKINDYFEELKSCNEDDSDLTLDRRKIVVDYLNLCAEEYFWFEKGRIDQRAWESWEAGMKTWAKVPVVQKVFNMEMATWTSSYYRGFQDFFKKLIGDV